MSSASRVVGIEMVSEAVEDARQNAQLNGITNAQFICGKVEDVIKDQLSRLSSDNVVGVLDPPRGGLHNSVIHAIRRCPAFKKLVYVACKPNSAGVKTNIIHLCKKKSNSIKGEPFRVVRAIPMDLFPHTPHCEMVLVLEKTSPVATVDNSSQLEPGTVVSTNESGEGLSDEEEVKDQGSYSRRINSQKWSSI